MKSATLPLGSELVLECQECGARSSDDLRGADGWAVVGWAVWGHMVDLCPECALPARSAQPARAEHLAPELVPDLDGEPGYPGGDAEEASHR